MFSLLHIVSLWMLSYANVAWGPQSISALLALSRAPVSIVYDADLRKNAEVISAGQQRALLAVARAARPPGRDVWFVLITWIGADRDARKDPMYQAEIFYEPEKSSPNVRKGKWAKMWLTTDGKKPEVFYVHDFLQIAPAEKPFGVALDLPASGPYMPFDADGDDVSDANSRGKIKGDQVVLIVRALYARYEQDMEVDRGQRIQFFQRERDNQICVNIGTCETTGHSFWFVQQPDGSYQFYTDGGWVRP